MITLRCRAYPEEESASEAWHHIDILRQIRNHAIRDYYSYEEGNRPNKYDQHKKLTEWKRTWSVFKEPSAHAAQQAISQIHKDIETLKERQKNGYNVGRLKWQGKGEFRSISYNESSRYDVDHNTGDEGFIQFRLEKIGWMRVRAHRNVPEAKDISRVVLKKEKTDEWYVSFTVDTPSVPEKPSPEMLADADCVGVDLGIQSYIHTSDNLSVDSLDLADEYERYAREQRVLARKEHGSNNWEKQRRKVAKAKRSIRRKVLDFQHKLTTWLVKEYDLVAVEDLNVKPMLETQQSAKSKQDAAWSRFLRLLEYKGDLYGTHVIRVNPAGTSKECSQCGVETPKPVWVREHSCPACGHEEDRDLNAAKNILSRGKAKVGVGCSESTPVETALPTSTSLEVDAKRVIEAGSPEA
ncbi:RNA-guided endonuclease InsQ/TnpB family protein [Haloparvum sp. AD34]